MNEIKVSINRNGLLSKKITFKILNNRYDRQVEKIRGRRHKGDSSKLQGDLNFSFDQRESEVNLHKAISSPESPSNVSPDLPQVTDKLLLIGESKYYIQ